ncbi:hypothetical protein AB0K60_16015 [Thermopolyspora sp. NPDC052614]|uniref:hypothetical protein n=1 Tax=Thermopolyspora sp. NPDC052614 TaxID=3155682 RepID=UPI00342B43DD
MTTPLTAVGAAREALRAADEAVRAARGSRDGAVLARDTAIARGDGAAADAAADRIAALDAAIPDLEAARARAADELTGHREALLGTIADPFALLDGRLPLLLLPARLETRFAWQDPGVPGRHTFARPAAGAGTPVLLVRIFPDDLHVDAHDPALTPRERSLRRTFLDRVEAGRDLIDFVRAWEELIAATSPARAAWIAHSARLGNPREAPDRWRRGARAALLPDRWLARARIGQQILPGASTLVREPLDVSPAPLTAVPDWMLDFAAARKAGMALTITLPPTSGTPRVDELIVVGAHVSRDPASSAAALEALLDAHHYTDGLSFVRPGAPTNALPGTRPDRTSRPPAQEVFRVEGDLWPLVKPGATLVDEPAADGNEAARLLGIGPSVFGHVHGADLRVREAARCVRRLLADVALPTLRLLWSPVLTSGDLLEAGSFLAEAVEGLGPIPAIRVGDQPYGILPVGFVEPGDHDLTPFESRLLRLLNRLRTNIWEPAAADLPRIGGKGTDPTRTLLSLLRADGVTRRLAVRTMLGPVVAAALLPALAPGRLAEITQARQQVTDLISMLAGGQPAGPARLAETSPLSGTTPVTVPFVQPDEPGPGRSAHEYLDQLSFGWSSTLTTVRQLIDPAAFSGSLLSALARTALLTTADHAVRAILRDEGVFDPQTIDAWDHELDRTPLGPTIYYRLDDRFGIVLPAHPSAPVADLLLGTPPPSGAEPFLNTLETVRELAYSTGFGTSRHRRHPPELLEAVLRSELGLLSHRLDAWFTALATERLRRIRAMPGRERGLTIGAWGVLYDVTAVRRTAAAPADLPGDAPGEVLLDPMNAGHVHAPGVGHAAAAAVLRSAHLAHRRPGQSTAAGEAFSVDLSSRRVRTALTLLDGVREGQPLAALLGYRVERILRARAPHAVAVVRRAAPLVANKTSPQGPVEQVAADNVVDALRLIALTGSGDAQAVRQALRPHFGTLTDAQRTSAVDAVTEALADAREAADAVADVLVSEGVFQLVRGNPARSAGGTDALSGAGSPPPEPEVVAQPRTGTGVTLRAAIVLPAEGPLPADRPEGWAVGPRAELEPALERWARAVLPDPATVNIAFTGGADRTLAQTLAQLQAAATTGLRMSALDFVACARPALEARLLAMARLIDPAVSALAASDSLTVAEEMATALRNLLTAARPLQSRDFPVPIMPAPAPGPALARVDALVQKMIAVRDALRAADDRDALVAALLAADQVGAANAVPPPGGETAELAALAAAVAADLTTRLAAHDALPAPDPADESARAAWAYERVRAAMGPTGWVLPALGSRADPAFAGGVPAGVTPRSVAVVVAQRARVRPGVARLDRLLGCVEAVHATVPAFAVTQHPIAPGERWVALTSAGERTPGGRVSVFAHTPFPGETGAVAGLLLDDWTEVVPATHETTSLTFHYDAPTSAAPNVALLGVLPPNAEQWSADAAVRIVEEGLALARLRAVDPHTLPLTGQLLPALMDREDVEPGVGAGLSVSHLTDPS